MSEKHTPTPWTVHRVDKEAGWIDYEIHDANGIQIGAFGEFNNRRAKVCAELTVLCVNAHGALVEALQEIADNPCDKHEDYPMHPDDPPCIAERALTLARQSGEEG